MTRDGQPGRSGPLSPIPDDASAVMRGRGRSAQETAAAASAFRGLVADQLLRCGVDADAVLAATALRGFSGRRGGPTEIGLELPNGIRRVIFPMLAMDVVMEKPPASLAIELANLLAACWKQADATAAALTAVADAVQRFVAEPDNAAMGIHLVGIEPTALSSTSPYKPTAVVVCMSMLDRNLDQADVRLIARDPADAVPLLAQELPAIRRRWEKRLWLDAQHADYLVDAFTLELLAYLGVSLGNAHGVVGQIGAELDVPEGGRITRANLERLEGVISSQCELNENAYWDGDCLLIRGVSLPETVLLGAKGRQMGDLVDHPLFDGNLKLARGISVPATLLLGAEGMRISDLISHPLFEANLKVPDGASNGQDTALFVERRYRYFRASDGRVWGDDEMRLPEVFR